MWGRAGAWNIHSTDRLKETKVRREQKGKKEKSEQKKEEEKKIKQQKKYRKINKSHPNHPSDHVIILCFPLASPFFVIQSNPI